jgi:hypothetical protein
MEELKKEIEELKRRMKELEDAVGFARKPPYDTVPRPYYPEPVQFNRNRCPVCNIDFSNMMNYCCTNYNCPGRPTTLSNYVTTKG